MACMHITSVKCPECYGYDSKYDWPWIIPVTQAKCDHCYCQEEIVYGDKGNLEAGKKHKKCCNCGNRKWI